MSLPLLFQEDAQIDFEDAILFYEGQRAGLGLEFMQEVDAALRIISASPFLHQQVFNRIHKCRVGRRFPYWVYYEPTPRFIALHAIWHTSRNPDELIRRL